MPEERDGQIDQGSKGEVGDLSDVARGFVQNVTAKGLARLHENCVDDAENGWLDSAGRWKNALPTKRVLGQALDGVQWMQGDTYASVAEHYGFMLDMTPLGRENSGQSFIDPSLNSPPKKKRKKQPAVRAEGGAGRLTEWTSGVATLSMPSSKCPSCNEPVSRSAKFCGQCGHGLGDWTCTGCSEVNSVTGKHCSQCGIQRGLVGGLPSQPPSRRAENVATPDVAQLLNQGDTSESTCNALAHFAHLPKEVQTRILKGRIVPIQFGYHVAFNMELDAEVGGNENDLALTAQTNGAGTRTVSLDSARMSDKRKFKRFKMRQPKSLGQFVKGVQGTIMLRLHHYFAKTPSQWQDKFEFLWMLIDLGEKYALSTIYNLYMRHQKVMEEHLSKSSTNWVRVLLGLCKKYSLDTHKLDSTFEGTNKSTDQSKVVASLKKEVAALNKKLLKKPAPKKSPSAKSKEICRNYNTEEGCQYKNCRYAHSCSKCGGEHPAHECKGPK